MTVLPEPFESRRSLKQRLRAPLPAMVFLLLAPLLAAQQPPLAGGARGAQLSVTVRDEDNRPVPGARLTLTPSAAGSLYHATTDYSGQATLQVPAGSYRLRVEKENFYAYREDHLALEKPASLSLTLRHVQEFRERVEVTDSTPGVDPAQTASVNRLTNRELFSLPYPTTRDFKQALPFIPQVVLDSNEQIHVAGAAAYELYHTLDGFDVTQPVTGLLDLRLSPDALRLINVQESRYSARYGKGSGGVLQLESGMGDDHFRVSATNFTPGLSVSNGLTFENVTPRFVFSGPIVKHKAWWFEALDGEYDVNRNPDLPSGRDERPLWRIDSLTKAQVNLSSRNILTASFLINREKDERVGLSQFTPVASTTDARHDNWLADVKDSYYFPSQVLLETGVAVSEFHGNSLPRGNLPFVFTPTSVTGSFFETSSQRARRVQGAANVFLPPVDWLGSHQIDFGIDLDALTFDQLLLRNPISFIRLDGSLARQARFFGTPFFSQNNFQASAYAQDRWSPASRLLVEYGLRGDWDEVLRQPTVSPRLAAAFLLDRRSLSKISFGSGLVYDVTNLDLLTRALQGFRSDQNFAADGVTPAGPPIVTAFAGNSAALAPPRFLNSSLAYERMLPKSIYLRIDLLDKRGRHGFDFVNLSPSPLAAGDYLLASGRNDRYDSVSITAHTQFKVDHELFASYTRSVARSNAVLDFSLDSPLFAPQAGGALPWDAPNRLITWGYIPLPVWRLDFAYSADWRTGFPFSVLNANQQLVGPPDRLRFPDFFSLDLHLERRFHFEGREFAIRLGVNNATGRKNPALVNNDVESPQFLTFGAFQHRAFTARIRFLGRK